jgi:hypothetical protein
MSWWDVVREREVSVPEVQEVVNRIAIRGTRTHYKTERDASQWIDHGGEA